MTRLFFFMFLIASWIIAACTNNDCKIHGSTWSNKYNDDEIQRITFERSDSCKIYYTQMDMTHAGRYKINDDTLIIYEYELKYQRPGGGNEKELRHIYKYLNTDCKYYLVYYEDVKYDYIKNEPDRDDILIPFSD